MEEFKKEETTENTLEIFSLESFEEPKKKPKSKRTTILVVLFLLIVALSFSTVSYAMFQIDNGVLSETKEERNEDANFFGYMIDKIKSIFNKD